MVRKKHTGLRLNMRLDDETDRLLTIISEHKKITISDAIRDAIRQSAASDVMSKIADRLNEIEMRISATDRRMSVTATTEQMEKLSAQFVMLAETNNTNANRIAAALNKIFERGK